MGYVFFIVGIIGLYSWFGAKKDSELAGTWHEKKSASSIWLVIWIIALVIGIYLL